jgi:hypothetical protein
MLAKLTSQTSGCLIEQLCPNQHHQRHCLYYAVLDYDASFGPAGTVRALFQRLPVPTAAVCSQRLAAAHAPWTYSVDSCWWFIELCCHLSALCNVYCLFI